MKWYHFDQNNSGGYFHHNNDVGEHVFIQAKNEDQANRQFYSLDNCGDDWCECCGQRWYGCEEQDEPKIYTRLVSDGVKCYSKDGYVVLHYADGLIEKIKGEQK